MTPSNRGTSQVREIKFPHAFVIKYIVRLNRTHLLNVVWFECTKILRSTAP